MIIRNHYIIIVLEVKEFKWGSTRKIHKVEHKSRRRKPAATTSTTDDSNKAVAAAANGTKDHSATAGTTASANGSDTPDRHQRQSSKPSTPILIKPKTEPGKDCLKYNQEEVVVLK